jgi:7,8-dihydroneopterin aldolase/epimerase/oxygenase
LTPEERRDSTVITLRAMRFDGRIGILPHEAEVAQPIEVDLVLTVRSPRGKIGMHNILDYRHAYELVTEVVTAGHIDYLEEAADQIAERAIALPLVLRVEVSIRKMKVALPGPLAYAEVKVERSSE